MILPFLKFNIFSNFILIILFSSDSDKIVPYATSPVGCVFCFRKKNLSPFFTWFRLLCILHNSVVL